MSYVARYYDREAMEHRPLADFSKEKLIEIINDLARQMDAMRERHKAGIYQASAGCSD